MNQATPPAQSSRTAAPGRAGRGSRLLFNAVLFVFIIGAAAVATLVYRETVVQRNVYTSILDDKLQNSGRRLQDFFRPVGRNLVAIRSWYQAGLIDLEKPDQVTELIAPVAAADGQIRAIYLQNSAGRFYQLHFTDTGWRSDSSRTLPPLLEQPWLVAASEAGDLPPELPIWSPFLILPGTGHSGLLGALWWTADAGQTRIAAACGIDKQQLDTFAGSLPLADEGILVLSGRGGQLACMSRATGGVFSVVEQSELLAGGQTEHLLVAQALVELGLTGSASGEAFRFSFQGRKWWGTSVDFGGVDGGVQLSLLLPDEDLAARLEKVTNRFIYLLIALLALGVALLALLAHRYRARLSAGRHQNLPPLASEDDLRALIAGGETDKVEFKSTLRMNLAKGKPGKEVEISWLKTVAAFLNSEGGVLLIGVADDGEVLGIETDQFTSEDRFLLHYNNLIKEHLGLQNARYLSAAAHDLDARRVFTVACRPADEAVFVTVGKQESFYIRVASGSRQLNTSQIIEHLKQS